jgi:CheY-like chemotaxis protein
VVPLRGYGEALDRGGAPNAGFDHHLTKPVDPGALRDLLAQRQSSSGAA